MVILLLSGCLSLGSYSSATRIVIVNQYDKPINVRMNCYDLSQVISDYYLPAYSTYTLLFPRELFSSITLEIKGAYFAYNHSERCIISKYLPYQEVRPHADFGWLEVENNTHSKLYNVSFGSHHDIHSISDINMIYYPASRDYSNDLYPFSFILSKYIKVPYTTTDYITASDSYGGKPMPIGDKITVSPGEIVKVILSNNY